MMGYGDIQQLEPLVLKGNRIHGIIDSFCSTSRRDSQGRQGEEGDTELHLIAIGWACAGGDTLTLVLAGV